MQKKIKPYKIICQGGATHTVRLNKCVTHKLPNAFEVHLLVDEARGVVTRTKVKGFGGKVYRCKDRYKIIGNKTILFFPEHFGMPFPKTCKSLLPGKPKLIRSKTIMAIQKKGIFFSLDTIFINQFYVFFTWARDMGSSVMYYKRIT